VSRYILIMGNPLEGFTYTGPFDSERAAFDFMGDYDNLCAYVAPISEVTPVDASAQMTVWRDGIASARNAMLSTADRLDSLLRDD
jgi:hypothetical protein